MNRFPKMTERISSDDNSCRNSKSSVNDYFRGKSILITGATGFCGKVGVLFENFDHLIDSIINTCGDLLSNR